MITRIEKDGKTLILTSPEATRWWNMSEEEQDEYFDRYGH